MREGKPKRLSGKTCQRYVAGYAGSDAVRSDDPFYQMMGEVIRTVLTEAGLKPAKLDRFGYATTPGFALRIEGIGCGIVVATYHDADSAKTHRAICRHLNQAFLPVLRRGESNYASLGPSSTMVVVQVPTNTRPAELHQFYCS